MPKVSIVMPLYNKSLFLHESLFSILNQSFNDFELIVIDDQSADCSNEIVKKIDDSRIRFYTNSRNMGQADTLNNGLEKATGDYVTFAHGDDVWASDFLSAHLSLMEQFKEINISHSRAHFIDDCGRITYFTEPNEEVPFLITPAKEVLQRLFKGSCVITPTVFLRRGKFPFFSNSFAFSCDWDLWLKIAAADNDFLFINKPLIYYRTSADSVTSLSMKTGLNIIEDYLTLVQFFARNREYADFRKTGLRRLSMRALRLSREIEDRETIFLYHRLAILAYPAILLHPIFYLYVVINFIFGSKGMKLLKKISKTFTRLLKMKRTSTVSKK